MKNNRYIVNAQSLVTPYAQTRAGFLAMAFEKSRRAVPFIEEAKSLKVLASTAKKPADLRNLESISKPLLTASGVSEKAMKHLEESDQKKAIESLIKNFLKPAGDNFIDELVFRFLLTSGDALGGKMRNTAGTLGEWKFTRAVISSLSVQSKDFHYLHADSGQWCKGSNKTPGIEEFIKGLSWVNNKKPRTLLYNLTVPQINKKVDLSLLHCSWEDLPQKSKKAPPITSPEKYLALGELKGGIDPAGADEHWKTANSALGRIRNGFKAQPNPPFTFFIGAAIESAMAEEIYGQLKNGMLGNAANLTNDEQLAALCNWIIKL